MTAPTEGVTDARKWTTVKHESGYTLDTHRVTDDTAGFVMTPGSVTREVKPGEVLVRTNHPNVYTVYNGDDFDNMGLSDTSSSTLDDDEYEEDDMEPNYGDAADHFDPASRSASEVREYLSREDLSTEERSRVENAERQGANRTTAFPKK